MSKITEKEWKHLNHKSIIPSILFFIFSLVLGALILVVIVLGMLAYIVENKYLDASIAIDELSDQIYEEISGGITYADIIRDIRNNSKAPESLTLIDVDGNVVASYGNAYSEDIQFIDYTNLDVQFYYDDDFEEYGRRTGINIKKVIDNLVNDGIFVRNGKSHSRNDSFLVYALKKEVYSFDYWIQASGGNEYKVFAEVKQRITLYDCILLIIPVAIAALIFVLFLIIHLISAVANIISQRSLLKLLLKDPATGANNYLAYTYFVTKALSRNRRKDYAVVDLTLVKYNNYCTLYGTKDGELLLTTVSRCLTTSKRYGEYIATASNGKFILVLPKAKNEELVTRANEMIDSLMTSLKNTKPAIQGVNNLKLRAGLYIIPAAIDKETKERRLRKNINPDQLYMKAGIAKAELGEEYGLKVYNHEMWEKELWEQKVEAKMQEALDNKEFQVYIQPKYNPMTEELAGGEALVRWISPTEGFISPGKFIPIFEKTGFVTQLDDYMITNTAKLQSEWLKAGKKIVPISVNVSRAHFSQPDLAEHIRDLVDQYPLPHKYIEIELTESAFFDDKNALLSTVRRLQSYGFEVSMDDFGAGYSSLNSLKDLPLNVLKLDAEFFRGDDFDTRGEIVVSEAIALAKQLNMRIVAEGVEKKNQVDFLAKQNCDMIQGFYFAKPMPANEYADKM